MQLARRGFAEFVGTFWLVLAGLLSLAALLPSPPIARGDSHQSDPPGQTYSRRPTTQNYGILPSKGPAGTRITISAGGFRDFAPVESITMGGVDILGNRTVTTGDDGNFQIDGLVVPGLDPGVVAVTIRVGTGIQETTAIGTFEITGPEGSSPGAAPVREALEPLGDALERVFHFDNATKKWSFFDPRPDFLEANTLAEIREGQVYWIKVVRSLSIDLNGRRRDLTCANQGGAPPDCWNVVVW
jgi:hypothetical protein